MTKVAHFSAGRANYVKLSSIYRSIKNESPNWKQTIVEASSRNNKISVSEIDFLGIERPTSAIDISKEEYSRKISKAARLVESVTKRKDIDVVLTYGDLPPTLGAALGTLKSGVMLVHVESGLRNNRWDDEEEINRVGLDHISSINIAQDQISKKVVKRESKDAKVKVGGNTIIDTARWSTNKKSNYEGLFSNELKYNLLVTIHRKSNLRSKDKMEEIRKSIRQLTNEYDVLIICPEPDKMGNVEDSESVDLRKNLRYYTFINTMKMSDCLVTDSGSQQDEAAYFGVPRVILLNKSHRLMAEKVGYSRTLLPNNYKTITSEIREAIHHKSDNTEIPSIWTKPAGKRILGIISDEV